MLSMAQSRGFVLLLSCSILISLSIQPGAVGGGSGASSGSGKSGSSGSSIAKFHHLDRAHSALKAHQYKNAYGILAQQANKGCPYSQTILGQMHALGVGVERDFGAAETWLTRAASAGYGEAQLALGKLYLGGRKAIQEGERDIVPDIKHAAFWIRRAAEQGVDGAHELLNKIPGESDTEARVGYSISETRRQASQATSQSQSGVVEGWKGYADVVNTLNQASNNK